MKNEKRIETIKFATRFVNKEAIYALTDISRNTYIIKNSTGVGATTALLNYRGGNYLIIMPNVGTIECKEKNRKGFDSSVQFYIYYESIDKWKDVEAYLDSTELANQNVIISTTPDQLSILKTSNEGLYHKITQIPVFVDELHVYFEESQLRKLIGEALELIYYEWKACFTLSTATPTYKFLDIPKDIDIKYYSLVREHDKAKKVQYTEDIKHLEEFVYDEHNKGNKVVVFTNNESHHKKFTDLKVVNKVGNSLDLKLAPFGRGNLNKGEDYKDCDVIFLSSRYFAGYDLDMDCSVCIVSEQKNEAFKINITNLVQAYGRIRQNVPNALYVNKTSNYDVISKNLIEVPRKLEVIDTAVQKFQSDLLHQQLLIDKAPNYFMLENRKYISPSMHVNRALLFSNTRNIVNDYHQYNKLEFIETLEKYNFIVSDYVSTNLEVKKYKTTKLNKRLLNLLSKDVNEFNRDYMRIKYNIKHLRKGTFNCKLALEYLTAYLIKMTGSKSLEEKLHNKSFSVKDFYKSMDSFLRSNVDTQYYFEQLTGQETSNAFRLYNDEISSEILKEASKLTNEWQMLYRVYQINSNGLSDEIQREMTKHIEANNYDLYRKYKDDKGHRATAVKTAIRKRLEQLSKYLNNQELEWLSEVVGDVYKRLDKGKELYPVTKETLRAKMVNYLVFLLTDGYEYRGTTFNKSREYNSMVGLPKVFRKINPLIYLEIDLTAATPQLLDRFFGINNGLKVYSCLMKSRGISRDKAKTLFNSTVNNHELSVKTAKNVYRDGGFQPEEALALAKLTAQVEKGSFYEFITKREKEVIEKYQRALGITCHRHHDGIVISKESIDFHHITIPNQMDGYTYHVNVHNDGSAYDGSTTDTPHNSKDGIENFQWLRK